ncbi:LacI family DNA-binding transcriptional regulator [Salibacterium aidingense]|uniref:LacI family DNA-binding transcriptional regulator n=1 Tax=Salibacterium aidingense TaxID=384933 RepID=UPI003BBD1D87
MATIDDVAKAAGVSKSTVSNVFTKKRPISKGVSDKVLEVSKQLNYKPNYWARTLATKETRIIGLNMQAERIKFSQFHLSLVNGVLHECYGRGYQLLINTLSSDYKNDIQNQVSNPVDGEILMDPAVDDERIKKELSKERPCVVIGKPPKHLEQTLSYIDNDNVGIAYELTSHLLTLGHENILFLNAAQHKTVALDRAKGFQTAFEDNGKRCPHELILNKTINNTSIEYGYDTAFRFLQERNRITAVIADTDKMALGVYQAASALNITIPKHLSVFAFSDDSVFESEFQPRLSSAKLNAEQLGEGAARLLIEQIQENNKLVKRIVIPSEVCHRGSTSTKFLKG